MPKCRACGGRLRRDWPKRLNPVTGQYDYFHGRSYRLYCDRHWRPKEDTVPDLRGFWDSPDLRTARRFVDHR